MTPLLLLAGGLGALVAGMLVLRTFGLRLRVGRLLAATPRVSVDEAIALARSGRRSYVRIDGRIDSTAEFEGPAHTPLVLRFTRFQRRQGSAWLTYELSREVVPFTIDEGLSSIAIDGEALDVGLVVVARASVGTAAEAGDRAPGGAGPETPVRVLVEQVSSVDHATVLGVPVAAPDGGATMTAGLGRPLVLTTLEPPEAMRILADGASIRPRVATILLAVGVGCLALSGFLALAEAVTGVALAASPEPTRLPGSDTRSPGEGPGLVGEPVLALVGVLAVATLAVVATLAYVRLTDPRSRRG